MREAFIGHARPAALRAINNRPELEAFRSRRAGNIKPLREMVSAIGDCYGQVFTRLDCKAPLGADLISQVDMFAAEPHGRRIRLDSMPKPEKHRVHRWQILVAGAGQMGDGNLFGRSILADDRLSGKFLGPDTVALTFHEPGSDENLWASAFLNTPIGLRVVRSCAYGTSIPHLRLDLLAQLPIPLADAPTVARVAALVRTAAEQRDLYAVSLGAARRVIEALPAMQEALAMCRDRRARCVVWAGELRSLAAWNVASAGEALGYLRRSWSSVVTEQTVNDGIFFGNLRKRFPSSPGHGFELISQALREV